MKKDAEMKQENVKTVGTGVGFERIRRITGYLVGTVDRFNNGKRAEENDRVKHMNISDEIEEAVKTETEE